MTNRDPLQVARDSGTGRNRSRDTRSGATSADLARLTSLRIFAALAVFGFHVGSHTNWLWHDRYVRYGYVGVSFFFILSGFVLTWSFRPGLTVASFYVRRVARVYPSHLVTAVIAFLVPVTVFSRSSVSAMANVLLVQAWSWRPDVAFSLNGVSWSLSCEAFFYLMAPFGIPWMAKQTGRRLLLLGGGWAVSCGCAGLALTRAGAETLAVTNPVVRSGEFFLGVALALLVRRGIRPRVPVWAASGALIVMMAVLTVPRGELSRSMVGVIVALPCAALVLAAATADLSGGRRSWLQHRRLVYLGQVSFSFYLVHELVIVNLLPLAGAFPGPERGAALILLAVGVSAFLAVVLHEAVELPMQSRILRWYRSPRRLA